MPQPRYIVVAGIQGSGKGTQCELLLNEFGFIHFNTGQELRNFASRDTKEAQELKELLAWGNMVPDAIWKEVVGTFIKEHSDNAILFDGAIRKPTQLEAFNELINTYEVLFLDLEREEALKRLAGRRVCSQTGKVFGPDFVGDTNPENGAPLIVRDDDTPEGINRRLDLYYERTLPLLETYKEKGVTVNIVDAGGSIEEVYNKIKKVLDL